MKKFFFARTLLFFAIIWALNLQSSYGNSNDEGSGKKRHKEGSGAHSHEGSSSKKYTEGSGSHQDHETMAKMKEFATPNENHKALNALIGDWSHTVKWWMSAEAEPEESSGTTETKWIMGGRFLQQTVHGTAMGQPFEGMGLIGYDNGKKEYNSIWIDSMGTGFMKGAGQFDTGSKTLTEKGHFTCPFRGQLSFRGVTKIKDDDNYTYEMYSTGFDDKEYRTMEITFTRK